MPTSVYVNLNQKPSIPSSSASQAKASAPATTPTKSHSSAQSSVPIATPTSKTHTSAPPQVSVSTSNTPPTETQTAGKPKTHKPVSNSETLVSIPSQPGGNSGTPPAPQLSSTTPPKSRTPIRIQLEKETKEQILVAIEDSGADDDNSSLICIQPSQSEVDLAEQQQKLQDLPVVRAFNEAEKKKLSRS